MLLGVQKNVKEWTFTFPSEFPFWEFESQWILESLEGDCKGQNPLDWKVIYIIEKLLKHELWPKERPKVKLAIWFPITKSQELTWFPCMQVVCDIPFESSWRGLQLCCRPHLNQRFSHKVMRPQSCGSPNFGNFGIPIWESQDKMPFGCGPCGEAQNRLQGGRWWVLPSPGRGESCESELPVARPSTKSVPTMH
jgi:hypothetical protein